MSETNILHNQPTQISFDIHILLINIDISNKWCDQKLAIWCDNCL